MKVQTAVQNTQSKICIKQKAIGSARTAPTG